MEEYHYQTKGVCSQEMIIQIEQDRIKKLTIIGGCAGNTKGICKLVEGMSICEVIKKLKGIPCGTKQSSCPDQLATALEQIQKEQRK